MESICFEPMSHLGEHHTGVLINHKLILTGFEHPESAFLVEVNTWYAWATKIINSFFTFSGRPNSSPSARVWVAIFKHVPWVVYELDLAMLLWEIVWLNIHCEVQLLRIARPKQLTIWSGVDVQKLALKHISIGALEDVIIIIVNLLRAVLYLLQLLESVAVLQKQIYWGRHLGVWVISNLLNFFHSLSIIDSSLAIIYKL